MRILFVIKSLSAAAGGAERVFTTISTELAHRGHEVAVATFDGHDGEDFYCLGSNITRLRLTVGDTRAPTSGVELLQRVRKLRRLVVDFHPDVAVGFMHSSFVPLALALSGSGVPAIGSERTSFDHYRSNRMQRLLIRTTVPLLCRMTVSSESVRNGFPSAISRRMTVIPNPVTEPEAFANPFGLRRKSILAVGGFRPEKNHGVLIAAFAEIARTFPDWSLRLVGKGALESELKAQTKLFGISERVEFTGALFDPAPEYQRAQLFVLPSRYEGFPNSLAEALAHGLPAVGFADCPGTNDLILDGVNGVLVDGDDRVGNLALALESLMSSPELRMKLGAAARDSILNYTLESVVDRWEAMLRSAAERSAEVL